MESKFDLSTSEGIKKAQEELAKRARDDLAAAFDPKQEYLDQLIVSSRAKIPFDTLEHMDFLIYETDFRHAFIVMGGIYAYAQKKANDEANGKKSRTPNYESSPANRVLDVEKMIRDMSG